MATGLAEQLIAVAETRITLFQVQKGHQQGDAGADARDVAA